MYSVGLVLNICSIQENGWSINNYNKRWPMVSILFYFYFSLHLCFELYMF
jgi:hypothetical protein